MGSEGNCSPQNYKVPGYQEHDPTWQDHGLPSHHIYGPMYKTTRQKTQQIARTQTKHGNYPMREQICYLQSVQGLEHSQTRQF